MFSKLNILYIGDLRIGTTSLHRQQALQNLGNNVALIHCHDVIKYVQLQMTRIVRILFNERIDFFNANAKIIDYINKNADINIVWIDKGIAIRPKTLIHIKKANPDILLVHYSPDDMLNPSNQSSSYIRCIPIYDFHITTKSYNISELKHLGAKKTIFTNNAFNPNLHKKIILTQEDKEKYGAVVAFIGAFEKDRFDKILFLAKNNVKVKVWGKEWKQYINIHPNLEIIPENKYDIEYSKILNATKINLCFLRKVNRDLQTTRSMEIPACGGFMLAERTKEHSLLFEEGVEADFFDNEVELLNKVRYYMNHLEKASIIAARGNMRCVNNYTNEYTLSVVLSEIEKLAHNYKLNE